MKSQRTGKSAKQTCYHNNLLAAIRKFLPKRGLPLQVSDNRVRWAPRLLAMAAILISWSAAPTLQEAFATVWDCLAKMYVILNIAGENGDVGKNHLAALRGMLGGYGNPPILSPSEASQALRRHRDAIEFAVANLPTVTSARGVNKYCAPRCARGGIATSAIRLRDRRVQKRANRPHAIRQNDELLPRLDVRHPSATMAAGMSRGLFSAFSP